jgi:cytochrome c oxidase cbb3-type subunit 3
MALTNGGFCGRARKLVLVLAATLFTFSITAGAAQPSSLAGPEKEVQNPLAGDPEAIQVGRSNFRMKCSICHGVEASGGSRGPDLTRRRWTHGSSDAAIFRTINEGVPGTEMPGTVLAADEVWAIIAYLRSLSPASAMPIRGNREAGEQIFFGSGACSRCHMVNGRGGRLGPSLSRIAASRGTQYLIESIRDPNKQITIRNAAWEVTSGYETVRVVTQDGRRITGVLRNEDSFSIQFMDQREEIHTFLKKDLREVAYEQRSLMPEYTEQLLSDEELQNLLAYLDSLR